MKNLENEIFEVLKEVDIMIKNNDAKNIDEKINVLNNLLNDYLKKFK